MRLTLRTLLAYLDDRLPPEKAREIGLKIQKSGFATELVERVREVKRRRRVATDQDKVPPVDANLIAEYLDDQLAPEVVARLEQRILASDALLAEVASAHELLGMLREPVPVESRLRERLLTQDPTGAATSRTDSATEEPVSANPTRWTESPAASRGWLRWSPVLVGVGLCAWLPSVLLTAGCCSNRSPIRLSLQLRDPLSLVQRPIRRPDRQRRPLTSMVQGPPLQSLQHLEGRGAEMLRNQNLPGQPIHRSEIQWHRCQRRIRLWRLTRHWQTLPQNSPPISRCCCSPTIARCCWQTAKQARGILCCRFPEAIRSRRHRTSPIVLRC